LVFVFLAGERRIRVVTLALPTTSSLHEIYNAVDAHALAHYLSANAVARVLSSGTLDAARDGVVKALTDVLGAYRATIAGPGSGGALVVGESLRAAPLLALALVKSAALRPSQSPNVRTDVDRRAYALALLNSLTPELLLAFLCPNFYSLHDMPDEVRPPPCYGYVMGMRLCLRLLILVWVCSAGR
jgi:protein transport protein SEC24